MTWLTVNALFIAWSGLLAFFSSKNLNLRMLLILMMIPKIIDIAIITPLMPDFKNPDYQYFEYRWFFYVPHVLNDILMLFILKNRLWVAAFLKMKFTYRKMWQEDLIFYTYVIAVFFNLIILGEYWWRYNIDNTQQTLYDIQIYFKLFLTVTEALILSWLTGLTILAVIELRKSKLI